jgi:hypothetical protein
MSQPLWCNSCRFSSAQCLTNDAISGGVHREKFRKNDGKKQGIFHGKRTHHSREFTKKVIESCVWLKMTKDGVYPNEFGPFDEEYTVRNQWIFRGIRLSQTNPGWSKGYTVETPWFLQRCPRHVPNKTNSEKFDCRDLVRKYEKMSGWWFQPSEKYESMGRIIPYSLENKECLKPPTRCCVLFMSWLIFPLGLFNNLVWTHYLLQFQWNLGTPRPYG